jgi:hypothetical protein
VALILDVPGLASLGSSVVAHRPTTGGKLLTGE